MDLIKFQNISKSYNEAKVLEITDLTIRQGEVVGVLGNNGAGKTTCFSLLLDLIKASSGQVYSKGTDVSLSESWKAYTSAFLDTSFLIDFLTPDEYFDFLRKLNNWSKDALNEFLNGYTDFFNDEILGKQKYIRDLSKGNQKKTGIVGTFIGNPEIIVLDEPFASLDPSSQIQLKTIIARKKDHHTFLLSSHDLTQVIEVCSRFIILEKGHIVMDELKNTETISKLNAYFENALR